MECFCIFIRGRGPSLGGLVYQMIRAWRTSFDKKFRTLGAFFQKLRFFLRDVSIYHANDVSGQSFFSKVLLLKITRRLVIYTPFIMYFYAKE